MVNKSISFPTLELKSVINAKHIAIPSEHGAWIFLLTPLLIGLFLGGFSTGSVPLVLILLAAFLIRQPVTMLVKIHAGRRNEKERFPALVWFMIYAIILLINLIVLIVHGYAYVLFLAVPAVPVFVWHLWLVSKRAERRKKLIEIAAGGVLALAAPAAYWVGLQSYHPTGWLLWILTWGQVTGTILYAYLRLNQRQLTQEPTTKESFQMGREAVIFNVSLLLCVVMTSFLGFNTALLILAFLIQPVEVFWGIIHPAIETPPKKIGIRQLIISSLFTVVFIVLW